MTQQPTSTPFSLPAGTRATHQDFIAREVFGVDTFASLTTAVQQQLLLLSDDVGYEVTNLAKWYLLTDANYATPATSDLPSQFNELFRLSWVAKALRVYRSPQKGAEYRQTFVVPAVQEIAEHYDPDFNITSGSSLATVSDNLSVNMLARSIISALVRQRHPVIPPFSEGIRTIREEFVKLWEAKRWPFRIRHVQFTIEADGSITLPAGSYGFDGFASKIIGISSNNVDRQIKWIDSTRFVQLSTLMNVNPPLTGTPQYFYTEDRGNIQVIHWLPKPDTAISAWANIIIKAPMLATNYNDNSDDNGLNNLPQPFRGHLRGRVIAALLSRWGREDVDSNRAIAAVRAEWAELVDNWASRGAEESNARPHQVAPWIQTLSSWRGGNVIGQQD
jgi:hypothetical protein